jgi:hypothetical protein
MARCAAAQELDLFSDDFNGSSLNTSIWSIGTWSLDRTLLGATPTVSGGMAHLTLSTYNPAAPGSAFLGTEIWTNAQYATGMDGLELEASVRVNAIPAGLVTSFFTYEANTSDNPPLADEIDFEDLSTVDNAAPAGSKPIQLTTWHNYRTDGSNYGDPTVHNTEQVVTSGVALSQFNTYRIDWVDGRVDWYVDGVLVRTATEAVPTNAMNVRVNFWAPASEWGAAYSSALQPVSAASQNATYTYDVDWVAARNVYETVSATAPYRVFTDRFKNGTPANSDSITNFWTQHNIGSSSVTETTSTPLTLSVAGAGYPQAEVASAVQSSVNFFKSPLQIVGDGIDFTETPGSQSQCIFRLTLTPDALTNSGDSEYTVATALSLRIQADDTVVLGYKLNAPNSNSEYANALVNAVESGPVRHFTLTISPTGYTLVIEHETSITDGTRETNTYTGPLSIPLSSWTSSGNAPGSSAIVLEAQYNDSSASDSMSAMIDSMSVDAVKSNWLGDASGKWSSPFSWSSDGVPNFAGANAIFGPVITAPRTVTVDVPVQVGVLQFNSAYRYTLAGSTITLSSPSGQGLIQVLAGSDAISAPVVLATATAISVTASGSILTMGSISGAADLAVYGPGQVQASSIEINNLSISGARVTVVPGGTAASVSEISTLASAGGVLDLTNNSMVVTGMTEAAVDALVRAGSLASSTAGTSGVNAFAALAVVSNQNGEGGPLHASFDGLAVNTSDVLVMYTYVGDTDLNGVVDASDLANALAGMEGGLTGWRNGDFNYDGVVNAADITLLLKSLAGQGAPFADPGPGGSSGAVPEPTSMVGVMLAVGVLGRCRRA